MCIMVTSHYECPPNSSKDPGPRQRHTVNEKKLCSNPKRCRGVGFAHQQDYYDFPCPPCFTGERHKFRPAVYSTAMSARHMDSGWDVDYEANILSYITGLYQLVCLLITFDVSDETIQNTSTELMTTIYHETQCREVVHQRQDLVSECSCFSTKHAERVNIAMKTRRDETKRRYEAIKHLFTDDQIKQVAATACHDFVDLPRDQHGYEWEVTPLPITQCNLRYRHVAGFYATYYTPADTRYGRLFTPTPDNFDESVAGTRVRADLLGYINYLLSLDQGVPHEALTDIMRGFLPLLYPSNAFGNDTFDFRYDPTAVEGQEPDLRPLGPVETAAGWKQMNDLLVVHTRNEMESIRGGSTALLRLTRATIQRVQAFWEPLLARDMRELQGYCPPAHYFERNLVYLDNPPETCGICRVSDLGGTSQDPEDVESNIYPKTRSHRAVRFKACAPGHAIGLHCLWSTFGWRTDNGFDAENLPWLCPYCRARLPDPM